MSKKSNVLELSVKHSPLPGKAKVTETLDIKYSNVACVKGDKGI